ncbi:hypothetical protein [Cetobacterium sp.]|uniref:hypothetical protein n=1 Tax=Cetobacterium sp. TaxID=2071632 RepID=UPI003EE525E3
MLINNIKEFLNIRKRDYRCCYCGVYTGLNNTVFLEGLPPAQKYKLSFCCASCRELYVNTMYKLTKS